MVAHPDLQFGALAVKSGFASSSEIELALDAQRETPAFEQETHLRLGEILKEMGTLTSAQVDSLLETQSRLRAGEPSAEAPAPEAADGAIAFKELPAPVLVQESGPPLLVNNEPLTGARILKPGDRLKAGDLCFTVSGEALEIHPAAASASAAAPEASAEGSRTASAPAGAPLPAPPGAADAAPPAGAPESAAPSSGVPGTSSGSPGIWAKIRPPLRAIDEFVARIPPALHTQRKYVLAGAAFAWLTLLLPWRIASNGNTVLGIQGPGWLSALLTLVPVAFTLFTHPGDPFTPTERIVSSTAAGLGLLVALLKFALPPAYATGRGIGLMLTFPALAGVLLACAIARAGGGSASGEAPTLGMRLWNRLREAAGSISGRRARELTQALDERDQLLRKLGEAALEKHPEHPLAAPARQAREAFEKAAREPGPAGGPPSAVRAQAAQKAADAKARRALGKLAQKVLEDGLPLAGQETLIAQWREAEARVKKLS
jgi:hypothetical protein